MNIVKQFIISALWGGLSSIVGVGFSTFIFDRFMTESWSNILGLIISWIVDYFLQRRLFMGNKTRNHKKILAKFFVTALVDTTISQIVFLLIMHHQKLKDSAKWEKHKLLVRYLITLIVSATFTFPAEKNWVFKN